MWWAGGRLTRAPRRERCPWRRRQALPASSATLVLPPAALHPVEVSRVSCGLLWPRLTSLDRGESCGSNEQCIRLVTVMHPTRRGAVLPADNHKTSQLARSSATAISDSTSVSDCNANVRTLPARLSSPPRDQARLEIQPAWRSGPAGDPARQAIRPGKRSGLAGDPARQAIRPGRRSGQASVPARQAIRPSRR